MHKDLWAIGIVAIFALIELLEIRSVLRSILGALERIEKLVGSDRRGNP